MKKPVISIDEPKPKKAPRADRPPDEGFVVVVDGHFKTEFKTLGPAEALGRKLKSTYPMLRVEIYDAAYKGPNSIELRSYAKAAKASLDGPCRCVAFA